MVQMANVRDRDAISPMHYNGRLVILVKIVRLANPAVWMIFRPPLERFKDQAVECPVGLPDHRLALKITPGR